MAFVSALRMSWLAVSSFFLGAVFLAACGESVPLCGNSCEDDGKSPLPGATSFVSADGSQGDRPPERGGDLDNGAESPAPGDGEGERTVEEGDIYRAFGENLLLNLNTYRGLQVIDLADPTNPEILGRLQISGSPVELYVVGERAVVLLNDWQGYYGSRFAPKTTRASGGLVALIDLSDPGSPRLLDERPVPGWIQRSRLVRGGGDALYVVAQDYRETSGVRSESGGGVSDSGSSSGSGGASGSDDVDAERPAGSSGVWTVVKSFTLGNSQLQEASELDLGGWIVDIQATPAALLVARHDWTSGSEGSRVSLIDISRADGVMVEGGEVSVAGMVESQFNMDLHKGVLRVVSSRTWGSSSNANHIQTFDVSNFASPIPIDSKSFGPNEDLYATLFIGNKAFFVTYERVDPFHAFEISDEGIATERSQFIVSGWNDFFRDTFSAQRLIGIGVDDAGPRTMAVSLYDISDLSNPSPLITRASVSVDNTWSEASWDHRAFSVIEDAVDIEAEGGERETGLVLLPYSGWTGDAYVSAVQIFTFSRETLTRRGVMEHGSAVRRSFLPEGDLAANLSEESLSLFAIDDPDQPLELGKLALAPSYEELVPFGDHAARLSRSMGSWYWAGGLSRNSTVEIIPRAVHPDSAKAIASFEVPQSANLRMVGGYLVAVSMEYEAGKDWPKNLETTVQVFDVSDPARPTPRGTYKTTDLLPGGYGYGYDAGYAEGSLPPRAEGMVADCFDCRGGWYFSSPEMYEVADALVFVGREQQRESLGTVRSCYSYPSESLCDDLDRSCPASRYTGGISCTTIAGKTSCTGEIYQCSYADDEQRCVPVDPAKVQMDEHCYSYEMERYWSSFVLRTLELGDPDAPDLSPAVELPKGEEAGRVLVAGDELFLSHKKPYAASGDSRPYVQYFVRRFQPGADRTSAPVNVPGELLAVDGKTLFTRDFLWGRERLETAVAKLELDGDLARLLAHRRFTDQEVSATLLDGAGQILVSHRDRWNIANPSYVQKLTILDADSSDLTRLATAEVDDWAELRDARQGRALFSVPGGLLVMNLDQPDSPYPQAFFALRGWPQRVQVDGRRVLLPAGPFGIYELGLDETNLLPPRD